MLKELKCCITCTYSVITSSEGQSKLVNVPELSDVETINNVLSTLNANVEYDKDKNAVKVDATKTLNEEALMNM